MKRKLNHPSIPLSQITILLAVVAGLTMLVPASAHAQSGTWTNLSGGSWATAANWIDGVIANGTDATADFSQLTLKAAPTITLDGPIYIGSLAFGDKGNAYGWTLNTGSGGPLTLAVSSDFPTITVSGQTTTLGLVLDGYNGLAKAGAGMLTLKGSEVNTITGGLVLSGGGVLEDFTSLAVPTDLINGGNTLKLSGGSLNIKGKSSGTTSQTLGDVTVGVGGGAILADVNGGTGTTISLGALANTTRGGSLIVGSSGANNTGLTITTTSGSLNAGIYGTTTSNPFVYTPDNGTTVDWATTVSSSSPYTISGLGSASYTAMTASTPTAAGQNCTVSGTIGPVTTILRPNTIKMLDGSTLNIAGNKVNIQKGSIICVGTTGSRILGTSGGPANIVSSLQLPSPGYDLTIYQFNSGGLTIGAQIGDPVAGGANPMALTKAGPGTLTVTNSANVWTGPTFISGGMLTVGNGGRLNSGTYAGRITNNAAFNYASSAAQTLSGVIAGLGSFTLTGPGTLTLSGANTYSGNTVLSGGKLVLSGTGTLANTASIQIDSGATLDVSAPTMALTLGSNQTLIATATGANAGGTNTVASGKNLTLSSGGLVFTAYGGGANAPLVIAGTGGSLALNGAPVTVTTTTALGVGTYTLIAGAGTGTTITGTPGKLTVKGTGVESGKTATLSVSSAGLFLTVASGSTLTSLAVTGFPNPTAAGTAGSVTVTAKDQNGNTFTSYTGTVQFTSSDGLAVLPSNYTFVSGDHGAHTFLSGVTLKTAGTQAITATDIGNSAIGGSQFGITVIPGEAAKLAVSGFPNPVEAGMAQSFTVTAKDIYGNIATNFTGTIENYSSDPTAVFDMSYYTFVEADAGEKVFSATLSTIGVQSITSSNSPTIIGTESGIVVSYGVVVLHAPFNSGFVISSNTALGISYTYNGIASPGPLVAANAPGGLPVTLQNLTAYNTNYFVPTPGNNSAHWRTEVPLVVGAFPVTLSGVEIAEQSFDSTGTLKTTGGTEHYFWVDLLDSNNNLLASERFAAISSSPSATNSYLAWTNTFSSVYGINLQSNATYKLRFIVSGPTTNIPALAGNYVGLRYFTVNGMMSVSGASKLAIIDVNGGVNPTAGVPYSVTVQAQNAGGSPENLLADTGVTLSLASGAAGSLGGTLSGTIAHGTSSVVISGVTNRVAESVSLMASTNSGVSLAQGTANTTIAPASAASFIVADFPSPVGPGMAETVLVIAKDPYGNTDYNYAGTVDVTSSDPVASFNPTPYSFAPSDGGWKLLGVTLNTLGTQYIAVTDTMTPSVTGTQTLIHVEVLARVPSVFDWTNTVSGMWSAMSNWTNDAGLVMAPVATGQTNYVLNFNKAGAFTANQDIGNGFLLNQLNFGGSTVTLAGNDFNLVSSGFALPQINQNGAASVTVSNNLALGASATIGGTGTGPLTLFGLISDVGSMTKIGSGTVQIAKQVNSYSGGTFINSGTLVVGGVFGGISPQFNEALGTGPVALNAGATLRLARVNAANDLILNGGTLVSENGWGATWNGLVTLNSNTAVATEWPLTFNNTGGSISGDGGFTKTGLSTLTLSAANAYTGATTVQAGTLICKDPASLGSGALNIGTDAKVNLNYSGDRVITSMVLGGKTMPLGTYGSSSSPAANTNDVSFESTGAGTVTVTALPPPPVVSFTGSPTNGIRPLGVTFTDLSTVTGAPITNRFWNFGDTVTANTSSTSVVHTYTAAGTYAVTLRVTSMDGSASLTKTAYITVAVPNPPVIDSVAILGTNIILSGTGGPTNGGYKYYVLTSTNVTLPVSSWITNLVQGAFATNTGAFIYSEPMSPGVPEKFYRILMP